MSLKFQITLPDTLAARLKREAARQKRPLAEFIRETMEERLRRPKGESWRNPFESVTDLIDSNETDLSTRVDEILYE
jgi:hypothetical protein